MGKTANSTKCVHMRHACLCVRARELFFVVCESLFACVSLCIGSVRVCRCVSVLKRLKARNGARGLGLVLPGGLEIVKRSRAGQSEIIRNEYNTIVSGSLRGLLIVIKRAQLLAIMLCEMRERSSKRDRSARERRETLEKLREPQ